MSSIDLLIPTVVQEKGRAHENDSLAYQMSVKTETCFSKVWRTHPPWLKPFSRQRILTCIKVGNSSWERQTFIHSFVFKHRCDYFRSFLSSLFYDDGM